MLSGMELTFHLPNKTEHIICMEADSHAAPVRPVDHHEKGMDLVMHGVIVKILYDADDMKGERLELIIVIVEDQIERVFHAEHRYGGMLVKRYEADRAVTIEREVAADMAVSLVSHAMWLGRELTAKEQQLR